MILKRGPILYSRFIILFFIEVEKVNMGIPSLILVLVPDKRQ